MSPLRPRQIEVELAPHFREPGSSVAHVARVLRENGLGLAVGRGRRRAEVGETPVNNLMLGVGVRDPVRAPEAVRAIRALPIHDVVHPDRRQEYFGGGLPKERIERAGIVICETFGVTLDGVLAAFVQSLREGGSLPPLIGVDLHNPEGALPMAEITVAAPAGGVVKIRFWPVAPEGGHEAAAQDRPATLTRSVTFWEPLFRRMAEVIIAATPNLPNSGPAPTNAAQNETEADGAPPPKASAPGQSANPQTVRLDNGQFSGKEKEEQFSRSSRAGRPPLFDGGRRDSPTTPATASA